MFGLSLFVNNKEALLSRNSTSFLTLQEKHIKFLLNQNCQKLKKSEKKILEALLIQVNNFTALHNALCHSDTIGLLSLWK